MKLKNKQTRITKIPHDWSVVRFEEIISLFHTGIWGENPTPNLISYSVIRSTEITHDGKIDVSTVAERNVPEKKVTKYKLEDGDIVLVASSGSSRLIGRAALFKQPDDGRTYLFSNFMVRIRPHNVDSDFLFYWLNSSHYYRFLQSYQQTSTGLRNLPKKEFKELKVSLPLLPEQRKIAEILSTVDEAIEKVDEAIEKTERLKNGLMQELLTKGIGHKEFKDTEIGIIPKEWKVVTAEEFCTRVTDGTHDTPKPTKEGQFLITSKHIKNGHIDFSDAYLISEENFDDINKRSQVNSFDVLFSMIGTIGETAVVDKYYPGFAIKNVGLFKVDGNKALAYWLNYYFKSKYARGYIRNNQKGTTQKYMPLFALRHFPILNPSIEEKERIINIINATVQQLEFLQKKKIGLRRIKKGMMNDLLTGNKRVNIFYHSNSSPLTGEDKGGGD